MFLTIRDVVVNAKQTRNAMLTEPALASAVLIHVELVELTPTVTSEYEIAIFS